MAYNIYAVSTIANNINILALLYEELSEAILLYDGINSDYIKTFKEHGIKRLIGLNGDEINTIKKYTNDIDNAFDITYMSKYDKYQEAYISKTTKEFRLYIKRLLRDLKSKLDISYTDLMGDK